MNLYDFPHKNDEQKPPRELKNTTKKKLYIRIDFFEILHTNTIQGEEGTSIEEKKGVEISYPAYLQR